MRRWSDWSPLVCITPGRAEYKPFFCVHGAGGNVLNLRDLANYLGDDVPFFALQAKGVDGIIPPSDTIDDMVNCYTSAIRSHQSGGPYRLGGYSGGGVVALEIARRLRNLGEEVEVLALIDTLRPYTESLRQTLGTHIKSLLAEGPQYILERTKDRVNYSRQMKKQLNIIRRAQLTGRTIPLEAREWHLASNFFKALEKYQPQHYDGVATIFIAEDMLLPYAELGQDRGWGDIIPNLRVKPVPGDHDTLVLGENVRTLALELQKELTA